MLAFWNLSVDVGTMRDEEASDFRVLLIRPTASPNVYMGKFLCCNEATPFDPKFDMHYGSKTI